MRLNHNMQSLSVFRNYKNHISKNSSALEKISTGSKINSSKDNPVKLGQSESLRMQIRGLQSAQRNVQDGVSMLQTADTALDTVGQVILRMKELTVQAGNDTNTEEDRKTIQKEIDQLKSYIDQTASNTEFNGNKLLGAEGVTNNDYPNYKYMQCGAMSEEEIRIPMFNISTLSLKDDNGNVLKDIDVTRSDNIDKALNVIDNSLKTVNNCRSKYGSIQQRMESTADNINQNFSSLEKAESNVRDADLALEMAEFSRTSILKDTATALLQQTNNFPKDMLSILQNMRK